MAFDYDSVLKRIFRLVAASRDYDPTHLTTELFRVGVDTSIARKAVLLTPIALGRVFLAEFDLPFTDRFFDFAPDGSLLHEGRLSREQVFLRALAMTPERIGPRAFRTAAFASPEVQAVSHAVVNGATRLDMVRLPLVSFTGEPGMPGLIRVQGHLARHDYSEIVLSVVGAASDRASGTSEKGISSVNVEPIPTSLSR